ncbi:unnamed protein product (macronuclear) [Paramecium tetraurelia]|uniref:Uncharacterized protein n=1 Tax=Paramecium tetraurelia TaxID=5888 RepID=A0CMS2_PARTE|nr:uncharacterized protein GSPATT00008568001 [Paramecium tetraurelia]CAK72089.1 unnamed protein product [Paramecium tetraurelia]|eukprot:XP_001439486.1 hypothetical protein (macronuclear) [Paramecium tetraurelia strain d4-2]
MNKGQFEKKTESLQNFITYQVEVVIMMETAQRLETGQNCMKIIMSMLPKYSEIAKHLMKENIIMDKKLANGKQNIDTIITVQLRLCNFEIIIKFRGGGDYDEKGKKQGKWEDLAKNFEDSTQLIIFANYQDDLIQGQKIIRLRKINGSSLEFEDLEVGNLKQGWKEGSWIEIADNFKEYCQILHKGIYKEGIKEGMWQIYFREQSNEQFVEIGGGFYENGRKVQSWIDIDDEFCRFQNKIFRSRQLIYNVEYYSGIKINFCEIKFRHLKQNAFQQIGKGEYNQNGMKDKEWVEPNDHFWKQESQKKKLQQFFRSWIIYKWGQNKIVVNYKGDKPYNVFIKKELNSEQGEYTQEGKKHGNWVQFDDRGFRNYITSWKGDYHQGQKKGEWIWQIFQKQINSWKEMQYMKK